MSGDRLDAKAMDPGALCVIGRRILCLGQVSSTQDVVREIGRVGGAEGTVVFAEVQEKGRGRRGRAWFSPGGRGLWFSVLLRPEGDPALVPRISLAAAVAVARAVGGTTGVTPFVKWPNDLLWQGRKLCGILAERVGGAGNDPFVILGVGMNVDLEEEALPPDLRRRITSLSAMAGRRVDRHLVGREVLRELDVQYGRLHREGFEGIRGEWRSLAVMLGAEVVVDAPGRRFRGVARDLAADGALLVETKGRGLVRVVAGDVSVRVSAP